RSAPERRRMSASSRAAPPVRQSSPSLLRRQDTACAGAETDAVAIAPSVGVEADLVAVLDEGTLLAVDLDGVLAALRHLQERPGLADGRAGNRARADEVPHPHRTARYRVVRQLLGARIVHDVVVR